jgi:cytochrome c-type biogenesis protein CcmH
LILFWLIVALLIVIALAFILPPLWQSSTNTQTKANEERNEANVSVYRDQLSELDADVRNGIVSREQFEQDREEIERRLLEDVSPNRSANPSASTGEQRGIAYALALALPLVAIVFYLKVGNPQAMSLSSVAAPAAAENGADGFSQQRIEANVAALAKRLETNPSDGQGWTMLARSYNSMEKYAEASAAFAKATVLVPNDADLWAEYAFAAAMASGRQLQGKPMELLNKALKVDPENLKALELAGTAAFQTKDYKKAIEYWQRVLAKVPPRSEVGQAISGKINEAKSLMGGKED